MVSSFRSTLTVRPGGSGVGAVTRLGRPPTTQQIVGARRAGIGLDPQTGRVLGKVVSLDDQLRKQRFAADRLFAQATGATAKQLGLESLRGEGSTFLRPEQTAQLLALRRGDDPVRILSGVGGQEVERQAIPSRSFQTAGGFNFSGGGATVPMGTGAAAPPSSPFVGRTALVVGAVALALFLFRGKR